MNISPKVLKDILDMVKHVRHDPNFIRITESESYLIVSTDDYSDPLVLDKNGNVVFKKFEQLSKNEIVDLKVVYEKETTNEK